MQLIDCQTVHSPLHWHETENMKKTHVNVNCVCVRFNLKAKYEKKIFETNIRLTNILDFGIKSRYRLYRINIVALFGRSDANDILCKSIFSNDQTLLHKTNRKTNDVVFGPIFCNSVELIPVSS